MKKKYEIFCFSAKKNVKIYNPCLKVETNEMKKKNIEQETMMMMMMTKK